MILPSHSWEGGGSMEIRIQVHPKLLTPSVCCGCVWDGDLILSLYFNEKMPRGGGGERGRGAGNFRVGVMALYSQLPPFVWELHQDGSFCKHEANSCSLSLGTRVGSPRSLRTDWVNGDSCQWTFALKSQGHSILGGKFHRDGWYWPSAFLHSLIPSFQELSPALGKHLNCGQRACVWFFSKAVSNQDCNWEPGDMGWAQWLRASMGLHKTWVQFPTSTSGGHSICNASSRGSGTCFWLPWAPELKCTSLHRHTHMHMVLKTKNKIIKEKDCNCFLCQGNLSGVLIWLWWCPHAEEAFGGETDALGNINTWVLLSQEYLAGTNSTITDQNQGMWPRVVLSCWRLSIKLEFKCH